MKTLFGQASRRASAALAFLAFVEIASAASTWIVPSGNWTSTSNWSGSTVPTAATDAIIDNGGTALISASTSRTMNVVPPSPVGGGVTATAADIYLGFTGTGTGNLSISGGLLSNNSTFIGSGTGQSSASISAGTWTMASILHVGSIGVGSVNMTGGIINDAAAYVGDSRFGTGTFSITGGSWRNGTLSVGQVGIGTLNLAGTGEVQINGGDKLLHLADGFGSVGTINFGTGALAGTLKASGITSGLGNATVNFNHTGTYTFTLPLSGNMSVNKLGLGTTVLTGSNTYVGMTTISQGTLQVGAGGTVGNLGTGSVVDNGSLVISRSGLVTLANDISGAGSLTTFGSGTIVLSGNNVYSGTTSLLKGVLQIDTNGRLGKSTLLINGGTMRYGAAFNDLRGFSIGTGGATVDTNGFDAFLANAITGTGALTKLGGGMLTLTGSNSYLGVTTISSGTLRVGDGASNGSLGNGNVVNNTALIFTRATSGTASNLISGAGSVSQTGPGTLTLAGANTYTGGTTLTNGGIRLGNAKALGSVSGSLSIIAGTLDLNTFNLTVGALSGRSAAVITTTATSAVSLTTTAATSGTYAGTIENGSGLVSLIQSGKGTLTLSGSNTYSGGTTLNSGGVNINSSNALGTGLLTINGPVVLDSTQGIDLTLLSNNAQKWNSNFTFLGSNNLNLGTGGVTLNGTRIVTVTSNILTVGGVISAPAATSGLTKSGTGTLLLTNNNTYLGQTTINAGLLQVGNGGTTGSLASTRIATSSQLALNRMDNTTIGGVILGTGSVRQMGVGTLTLTGANSYTGGTLIDRGGIKLGNKSALGFGRLSIGAATLDLNGFSTAVTSITGSSGAAITNTSGSAAILTSNLNVSTAYNGIIVDGSGGVALVLNGRGTLALNGNNTYTRGTTLTAGELDLGHAHAIGTGTLTIGGGILGNSSGGALTLSTNNAQNWNGNFVFAGTNNLDLGTGSVLMNGNRVVTVNSATLTVGGGVAATNTKFGLTKSGTGTLVLKGGNSYLGATAVSQGTLQIGTGGVVNAFATSAIANNGTLIFDTSNTLFYRGVISGRGSLQQIGSGLLFLSGANTFTGGTVVGSGTLRTGNLRALGVGGPVQINSGAVVEINGGGVSIGALSGSGVMANFGGQVATLTTTNTGTTTFAGTIADTTPGATPAAAALSLVKAGTGTLVLSGVNTYTGGTTISAGLLQLGNGGSTGSILGNVANSGVLAFKYGTDENFNGLVSGRGSLQQLGAGTTLTLTAANTYTGGTTIGAGASLKMVDGSSFGSGIVTDNGTLILDFNSDVALANVINGVGGLEKDGTGLLVLNGADTYSGGTVINSGTLRMGTARALGSAAGNLVINDGALDLFNQSLSVGSLAGVGANASIINSGTVVNARGATLTTTTAASTTFAGTIQDGVGAKTTLIKAGTGTLTLTGNNNYAGGTTINVGALQLGNGGTTGSITGNVTNKGLLIFDRSDNTGFAGQISGGGSVVQAGSGQFILSGSNSYTGGTAILDGTLAVGSDAALGRGNVALLGGTLATDGSQHAIRINGNLLWDSAATIKLTLTNDPSSEFVYISGQITLQGNSSLVFELNPSGLPAGHTNFLIMTVAGGFNGLTPANFGFVSNDPGFEGTFRVDGNNLWFDDGYEPGGSSLGAGVEAVPEPSTYALIALAFGAFLVWHRRAPRLVPVKVRNRFRR